jgi:hypothetical protein
MSIEDLMKAAQLDKPTLVLDEDAGRRMVETIMANKHLVTHVNDFIRTTFMHHMLDHGGEDNTDISVNNKQIFRELMASHPQEYEDVSAAVYRTLFLLATCVMSIRSNMRDAVGDEGTSPYCGYIATSIVPMLLPIVATTFAFDTLLTVRKEDVSLHQIITEFGKLVMIDGELQRELSRKAAVGLINHKLGR